LFKLIELGQVLGHNVQVDAFGGVLVNELGQGLSHIVHANVFNSVLGNELGQVTINSIKFNCKHPDNYRDHSHTLVRSLSKEAKSQTKACKRVCLPECTVDRNSVSN